MQTDQYKLTKWLNKLQRESWQLELVISGFSIFLMLGAWQGLTGFGRDIALASHGLGNEDSLLNIGYIILLGACLFILINLVLHVLLRGIWISTIGLRYVSGDIDFDSLKLAPKFDRLLRRKVGSFDQYILKLEKICSVVFSFTFLIVFMLISVGMYIVFVVTFINVVMDALVGSISQELNETLELPILILLVVGGLLYFIDFLTLGYLKRIKWLSHIYLPFYRLLSFITLSFLYRPIYYNLIDNKFGKWVGFLMLPYVIVVTLAFFQKIHSHVWYPDEPGSLAMLNSHYDDQRIETSLIETGSIPSKFVDNGFLQLFIAYLPKQDNQILEKICPDFEPFHEEGFGTSLQFSGDGIVVETNKGNSNAALSCLSQLYEIQIGDSLLNSNNFKFYRHPNYNEYGLVTMLDIAYLPRGGHVVEVRKLGKRISGGQDTLANIPFFQIPFWTE